MSEAAPAVLGGSSDVSRSRARSRKPRASLTRALSVLFMLLSGCVDRGGALRDMAAADSTARAMGARGEHVARIPVIERGLRAYAEEFERGAEAEADSLAYVLLDRLAFSRHALGDTVGWVEAARGQMRLLHLAATDSARVDEARRLAYASGFGDYGAGVRALRALHDAALSSGDTETARLALHCLDELVAAHPGEAVPVAQRVNEEVCVPTEGPLSVLLVALLLTWVAYRQGRRQEREAIYGLLRKQW
jgi:hypothetical protein